MIIEIDFNSDVAIYMQLRNQIIVGIATSQLNSGDSLPSVRHLAEDIGVNMHTVNKAYSLLREEGYVKLESRRGAVVDVDVNKEESRKQLAGDLQVILAEAICKGFDRKEVHDIVDAIYDYYEG